MIIDGVHAELEERFTPHLDKLIVQEKTKHASFFGDKIMFKIYL